MAHIWKVEVYGQLEYGPRHTLFFTNGPHAKAVADELIQDEGLQGIESVHVSQVPVDDTAVAVFWQGIAQAEEEEA